MSPPLDQAPPGRTAVRPGTALGAGLVALFLLTGRWSLMRLVGGTDDRILAVLAQPRIWVAAALLVLALAHAYRDPSLRFGLTKWISLLLGYVILTAAWGPDPELAFDKAMEVALLALMCIGTRIVASRDVVGFSRALWWSVVAITVPLTALALGGVLGGGSALADTAGGASRVAVLGGGPNVFARIVALQLLAVVYVTGLRPRVSERALLLVVAGFAVVLLLLSGSRGGIFSMAAALLTFAMIGQRFRTTLVLAQVGLVFGAFVLLTDAGTAVQEMVEHRIMRLTVDQAYVSGRSTLFREAVDMGLGAPLLGAGLAAFPASGAGVYPHNIFLELFCETGMVGLLGFVVVLILFLRRVAAKGAVLPAASVAAFVLYFVAGQTSGDLFDNRGLFVLMTIVDAHVGRPAPASSRGAQ